MQLTEEIHIYIYLPVIILLCGRRLQLICGYAHVIVKLKFFLTMEATWQKPPLYLLGAILRYFFPST